MLGNREWMYERLIRNKLSPIFVAKVDEFIEYAIAHNLFNSPGYLKCPCVKCVNFTFKPMDEIKIDIYRRGFKPGYERWTHHGEEPESSGFMHGVSTLTNIEPMHLSFLNMVHDAFGYVYMDNEHENDRENVPEDPLPQYDGFFSML
ncbi:hypothetical protein Droror1_Dr00000781 [Drosera rotundifolia]